MARRSSLLDEMFDIAASLPWKFSIVIAIVGYVGFHYLASLPVSSPADAADLANRTSHQLLRIVGLFMQYIVPGVFLIGAFFGFLRQRRQVRIHDEVASGGDRAAIEGISWGDFEILTAEVFRRKGFSVRRRGGNGPDGGIDLEMFQGKDLYLVQCKQWKSRKVGVNVVRELFGVMAAEGAAGGFVVASGPFTKEAEKFAEGRSIELVSTDLMLRLIAQTVSPDLDNDGRPDDYVPCPSCGSSMILRTSKQQENYGEVFWGCSEFPQCRCTRPAANR